MLYTTFIRLCDEATEHDDCQEFIMTLGWQSWMDDLNAEEITKELSLVFDIAALEFPELRKKLGVSMARMSALYRIPLRTIESWESAATSSRKPAPYIVDLIRFAVFVKEKEGDDGYLGDITE